ncbi:MAG: HEPN domain-containing protein [Clostridiales Family XIII bacterium]|nr:HEPN domain-containing protein [Clostridiales Family XIII bacterium]
MDERIEYWLSIADYDFETAKAMLQTRRYLYVGFMCHQTIEKAMKAVIARDCSDGELPPKIHDLTKLAVRAKLIENMSDEQQDFIEELNPLNIEARYPEYKKAIAAGLNADICRELLTGTKELLCWIKQQL